MNLDLTRELIERTDKIVFALAAAKLIPHINNDSDGEWDQVAMRQLLKFEFKKPEHGMNTAEVVIMAEWQSSRTRFYYLVMDGRAADGTQEGFERASVLYCTDSLENAVCDLKEWPPDANIWRGDSENGPDVFLGRG